MASIKDVAHEAGVSTATVSRVLAGKQVVRAETQELVLAAVEKLGYRPNHAARTLRSQRSTTIGLLVSDIRNPFFTAISRAVEDVTHDAGYSVFLCNTDEDVEKERMYLELMADENVAGVIYSPTRAAAENLDPAKFNFPLVLIDRETPRTDIDMVLLDNVAAAEHLTCHLLKNGYRRIFGIFGEASTTGAQRREGFLRALRSMGLRPAGESFTEPRIQGGKVATLNALNAINPPDAIFTTNSLLTAGALTAIRERNLQIPADVALVGFDETTWSTLVQPQVSVIAQPTYEIGQTATEMLFKRIENPSRSARRVILGGQLLARGSSLPKSTSVTP